MKILKLCYEFPPIGGGASRVAHGLSRELVRLGHEVSIVTMGMKGLPTNENIDGIDVHRIPGIRKTAHHCSIHEALVHVPVACRAALSLAKQRHFDINHTHFILPDGFVARFVAARTGLPYVITAHGSDVPGYDPHRLRVLHRVLRPVWLSIVNSADAVVSPSGVLAELIRERRSEAEVRIIPNGLEIAPLAGRRAHGNRVLVVSKILKRKGIQYLVQAMAGQDLGCEVNIVGDGPYLPELKRLVRETGAKVKLRGWLDNDSTELKELFDTSSIFVLPSESENFPIVLLEAMRAGQAIVTTRNSGCAEVVGKAALLVDPRCPSSLRSAVQRLVGDDRLRQELGEAARRRIETHFSWSAVAQQYVRLYEESIARRFHQQLPQSAVRGRGRMGTRYQDR